MNNPNLSTEALYKTNQQGVIAALRRQIDGLVMPNLLFIVAFHVTPFSTLQR